MATTSRSRSRSRSRSPSPPPAPTPKRRAGRLASGAVIMDAATTLFLRHGFLGTSVDDIAALAHVSKQTVYTHFADKEQLFAELVRGNIASVDQFTDAVAAMPVDSADPEQHLRDLARRHIHAVIQPRALQLRRLVIGESGRFPDLARMYYERIPQRVISILASHLQHLGDRGLLHLEDASLAANHLAWLVLAIPLDEAMFCGDAVPFGPAELDRFADAGVDVFLKAYGRH
jgi:TetR/AcrR family transcriptional regulator, mexJK operon transcriptional repressor